MKKLAVIFSLIFLPFSVFAENITATASTLDEAENMICAKAEKLGAEYVITGARYKNNIYVIAKIIKK